MPMIQVTELHESKSNPRKICDAKKDAELAESVKAHGVLTALLLRKRINGGYEVVFGSRRHKAAKVAKLEEVPAEIRELDDATVRELQLVENGQRADVHPLDEADAYEALVTDFKYDAERIAGKVSRPVAHVRRRLQLINLGEAGRKAWLDGKITEDAAFVLSRVPEKLQAAACKAAIDDATPGSWDVKERGAVFEPVTAYGMRVIAKHGSLSLPIAKAPFDTADATLVPKAGACLTCPKQTGTQAALFEDFAGDDRCLDPACWRSKCDAKMERLVTKTAQITPDGAPPVKVLSAGEVKKVYPYSDSKDPTYGSEYSEITEAQRARLAKAETPVFAAQRPDGTPVLLARKADVAKEAKAKAKANAKTTGASHGPSAAEKAKKKIAREKNKRDDEIEQHAERAVVEAFVAAAEKKLDDEARLRAVIIHQLESTADNGRMLAIAKRREISIEDSATGKVLDGYELLVRFVVTAKLPTLRGLFVELIVSRMVGLMDSELEDLAKAFGVNTKAVQSAAKKEAERTLDAKVHDVKRAAAYSKMSDSQAATALLAERQAAKRKPAGKPGDFKARAAAAGKAKPAKKRKP